MVGSTLSHFRIVEKVAEGGMGVVYKAVDVNLGRTVALKVLPPRLVGDEERRARFLAEARAAAAVVHPSIATVFESGEQDGVVFIAMEFVEGDTVRSLIGGHPLSLKDAVRLAIEIAEGLAAAHQAGVVHRDLKPDNVIVAKDGHVKILDFGLARLLEPKADHLSSDEVPTIAAGPLTAEGVIQGTPAYMSPEQARGQSVDFRTDLFSFGCMLYEMVTGRSPFAGRTSADVLSAILEREPVPATALNPEVPSAMLWILDKCLQKDPGERYQGTRDLVVDLRRLQEESMTQVLLRRTEAEGQLGSPAERRAAHRRMGARLEARRLGLGALVVLVALVAILAGPRLLRRWGQPVPPAEANSLAVFTFQNLKDPSDPERLGQVLQELLITDLSSLEGLKVFSSQRLFDVGKQIRGKGGKTDEKDEKEMAGAVAAQAGAKIMLTGSLSQLGERWILICQLVNVRDGTIVQSRRIDGTDLYAMVDSLTGTIQSDLRVSLPEDQTVRLAIKDKTTSSMEAYQHYLAGVDWLNEGQYASAARELERAVAIDPNFGQAYYQLAMAKWWPGDDIRGAKEPLSQLLDRRLYASKKEKLMAEGALSLVAQNYGEGSSAFQSLVKEYPDEKEVWYGYGEALFHFPGGGRELEALGAFQRAVALDPDFALAYQHIMDIYTSEKRYDEAAAQARELIARHPENPLWYRHMARVEERRGDEARVRLAVADALKHNTTPEAQRELYRMLARAASGRGDLAHVEDYLRKGLEADPGHDAPDLRAGLLGTLRAQRKFPEWKEGVRQALASNPTNQNYLNTLFQVYEYEFRLREALAKSESVAVASGDVPAAYRSWAAYAVISGDEATAARAVAEAERRHTTPDQRRALDLQLGQSYFGTGDWLRAKKSFEKALAEDPKHDYPDVLQTLGLVDLVLGNLDAAQTWLDRGLAANPKHPGLLVVSALLNVQRGRTEDAITYARKGEELYPSDSFAPSSCVCAYICAGRVAEAKAHLDSSLARMPAAAAKWQLLAGEPFGAAAAYLRTKRYDLAEETLQRAAALDAPAEDPVVLAGLAECAMQRGDFARADEYLRRGLEVNPRHPNVLYALSARELVRRNFVEAERWAREPQAQGLKSVVFCRLLGYVYAEQGRFGEARPWAEKAAAMDSSRASYELLAWVLTAGDLDVDGGLRLAARAMEMSASVFGGVESRVPFRATPEHTVGLACFQKGRYAEAVKYLEEAATLQPERESVRADLARAKAKLGT